MKVAINKRRTGERIKALRLKAKMGAGALGYSIGVDTQTVLDWEDGKYLPGTARVFSLAATFGVAPDEIIVLQKHPESKVWST